MANDEDGKTGAERRQHARFDTLISVDYNDGETFLFSYITNISEMGIFIRSDSPLTIGTVLKLQFTPQDGGEAFDVAGEVVWINPVRPDGENLNPGMGVRFIELDSSTRERVVDLVKTIAYLRDDADAN